MGVTVRALDPAHEEAWDRYVMASPEGTFFHLAGWRHVIERAFRHRTHYLLAERDGAITGVLPLVHMRSRLFGNGLVSVPFCVYGGPIACDAASLEGLLAHCLDLMRRLEVDVVEFRSRQPAALEWPTRCDLYATFRRPLAADEAANLKAIPRKQRAVVRKGIANGLRSRIDQNADGFHRLYAESVRNLGTPVFSRRYFRMLIEYFRDEVLPYYAGGGKHARQRAAHDFMYWELMRHAVARGFRIFDFGRSKFGTGRSEERR